MPLSLIRSLSCKIGQDDAYPLDGHYVLNHGLDAYSATTGNGGNDFTDWQRSPSLCRVF